MNQEVNFCDQCGEKVRSGAKFCSNCGCDLQNISTMTPNDIENHLKIIPKKTKDTFIPPSLSSKDGETNIGWVSSLNNFCQTPLPTILTALSNFIPDASHQQIEAWEKSLSILKKECFSFIKLFDESKDFSILIEYEIPRESRRPDVVILGYGVALVLELKGHSNPNQAFIDQAFAYGRDLQFYHGECDGKEVIALLVMVLSLIHI